MSRDRRVLVTTNADCIRRKLDAERLRVYFARNGFSSARKPEQADLILFVTCSYKQNKEDECVERIRELGRHDGELIVAGCLPQIAPERFRKEFKGRFVTTETILDIDRLFPHFDVKLRDVPDAHTPLEVSPFAYSIPTTFDTGQSRRHDGVLKGLGAFAWKAKEHYRPRRKATTEVFLRVGYGCVGGCAFCAINRAVGKLKSKPVEDCVAEYRALLEAGHRRFVIVSDNLGAYGLDRSSSLVELLDGLAAVDADRRVTWDVRQVAPKYVVRYREGLLKHVETGRVVTLLTPVQSGSPRILERMNRDPDVESFERALLSFRAVAPDLALKTEVILGFPSETEDDFRETMRFLEEVSFQQVGLFAYSEVYGTPAADLPEKVDRDVALERIRRARRLLHEKGVDTFCDLE